MKDVIELLSDNGRTDLTGNRLWVDRLNPCPGFVADRISFITYKNIEAPYLLKFNFWVDDEKITLSRAAYQWTPSAVCAQYTAENLSIHEKKYIGRDDIAVSVLDITNTGESGIFINYRASTLLTVLNKQPRALYNPNFVSCDNRNKDTIGFRVNLECTARNVLRTNANARFCFHIPGAKTGRDNDTLNGGFYIAPGDIKHITAVFSCFTEDAREAEGQLRTLAQCEELTERNNSAFQKWFEENVPQMDCSDPMLEKLYYYRWYVVYKNTINPGVDCFQQECIYEGKDNFALLCTASAAMQMRDARWMKHGRLALSQLGTLIKSQITEGIDTGRFRDMYLNDIPSAALETAYIMDCESILADVFRPLRRFVDWEASDLFIKDESQLPLVTGSWRTAAEYQPSFFEFTDLPWDHTQSNPFGNEHKTAVHRVEEAVYLYQNMQAVAKMAETMGCDRTANQYIKKADAIKSSIISYMWDENTKFFYDLHPGDLKKALKSKNFAGFMPARCDIADGYGDELFAHLSSEFNTPYPIPTTATDSPAFSPDNTWKAGPYASDEEPYHYGCCWNGPTWNYANSLVIDALGSYIQRSGSKQLPNTFANLFLKWCEEQNPDENAVPNSCEHYNPYTGEPFRDIKDYFHSFFIDIVMKYIVGIVPGDKDTITVAPIDIGVERLMVRDIPYRGHSIDFLWDSGKEMDKLTLNVDGKIIFTGRTLKKITIYLKGNDK